MSEPPRSDKPLLPPTDGLWLAHSASKRVDFYSIQYLRPLGGAEGTAVYAAWKFFQSGRNRSETEPLFEAYRKWLNVPDLLIGQAGLGSPVWQITEDRLMSFLLVWRMALDQLASATSSRHGKESIEWRAYQAGRKAAYDTYFGYRVVEAMRNRLQHQDMPPLTQALERCPYTCERCGKEHVDLHLSITMKAQWLLESASCPRTLKRDLEDPANAVIDIREAVKQSMRGFDDLIYTLLMSDSEAPELLALLAGIFDETAPDVPIIVKTGAGGTGGWGGGIEQLRDMEWVITRGRDTT